jgi:surfeit locus 1 family protein
MIRRLPFFPTLVVLVAAGIMVRLGFWQLDRLHQKEAMLAQFAQAQAMSSIAPWPDGYHLIRQAINFRQTEVICAKVLRIAAVSGRNAAGEAGWAHIAHCETAQGYSPAEVVLGWSQDPASPVWIGGKARGTFRTAGQYAARVIAQPPLAGLAANARPDPNDVPNNHLAYAVQWFLFAGMALVIYALALRKRLAGDGTPR